MSKLLHIAPTEGEEAALKFRRKLWEDTEFTDVTLEVVGGEKIHCHSVILAAASPALKQKLLKARHNQTSLDLDYKDSCSVLVLQKLMEFIYLGECQLPEREIKKLLEAGERLQVQGLCLPREDGMEKEAQVDISGKENVIGLLKYEQHKNSQSSQGTIKEFKKKLQEVPLNGTVIQEIVKGRNEQRSKFFDKYMQEASADSPNFKCNICGHESEKYSLQNHIENKHNKGTFTYNCIFCSKTFQKRSLLYDHTRKTHRKKKSMA